MPFGHDAPAWVPADIAKLREWRAAGLSNAEIGKRLGRTVKAVQSKAKALRIKSNYHFIPKPSQRGSPQGPGPERAGLVTLPPLPSLADE